MCLCMQVLFLLTGIKLDWQDASFGNAYGTRYLKPCKEDFSTTEQVRQIPPELSGARAQDEETAVQA